MSDVMVAFGKFRVDGKAYGKGHWLVYDAVEIALERPVRLRLYGEALPKKSEREQDFIKRIRDVAALDHPNILSILDFGIVMEKGYYTTAPRESAALQFMFAERQLDVLDEEDRLKAVVDLYRGLQHIHEAGLIHGAIGTDTIFWDRKRAFPYFAWFTILDPAETEFGTPAAKAPSGYEGAQADVFQLGRVAHQIVTGTAPLGIDDAPGETTAVNVPGATEGVFEVLQDILHKDPSRCPASAEDAAQAFDKVLAKQKVRMELEKSVSSFVVPQEMLEAALAKKKEQKRRKRKDEGISPAEMPYASLLESIPGGPKVTGIMAVLALMMIVYPFVGAGGGGATPAPRPATRPKPASLNRPKPATRPKPPTRRVTKKPASAGGIESLKGAAPTDKDTFLPRWSTLKSWILSLPPAKRRNLFTYGTLVQLRSEFKRDERQACQKLDDLIRQAVGEL